MNNYKFLSSNTQPVDTPPRAFDYSVTFENDRYLVKEIRPSSDSTDTVVTDLPDVKCYRSDHVDHEIKWRYMYPIVIVQPKFCNLLFDFSPLCYRGHGAYLTDSNNNPISPASLIAEFSEFQDMFELPPVQAVAQNMPALGLHIAPEQLSTAFNDTAIVFRQLINDQLTNDDFVWWFVTEWYYEAATLSSTELLTSVVAKLPYLLSKELKDNADSLAFAINATMTLSAIDVPSNRLQVVNTVLDKWINGTKTVRILKKQLAIDAFNEFRIVLKHYMSKLFEQKLEQAIFEAIKRHRKS